MLAEIAPEEFARTLDTIAAEVLAEAGWPGPPIDCLQLARRLGLEVAYDNRQVGRGRVVNLRGFTGGRRESIFLRPEPRPERVQWAVAHEIGEKFAHQVFAALAIDPREAPRGSRESVANQLAGRLLLPAAHFRHDASACGWELTELKNRYTTASHELIARRMLDFDPWIVITVFDNDRQTFRASNRFRRKPPLEPAELECRARVVESGAPQTVERAGCRVQGWPIYEAEWKREILRTQRDEAWTEPA
jgi:Zn-dependent peptidase ImmA (M78 family)